MPAAVAGRIAVLGLAVALAPAPADAQEVRGSASLYGWLPWIDGEVTSNSGAGSFETSLSAGDVLEALKFAFMAAGDVHYGRVGLLQDIVYAKLGSDATLSGPFASDIGVDTTMLISTTALGYQVYAENGWLLEPYAGARYVNIETDVKISGGGPLGVEAAASVELDWWDPVIGVRGRMPLTEKLSAGGFVDIGGFGVGSEFTWGAFAALDYAFNDRLSAMAGFRYLSIDYDTGKAEVKLDTYGPVVGMTLRF
jgi:hypothetical protein